MDSTIEKKQNKSFFEQPNNQKLNKSHFHGFVNSQYFLVKISGIVPVSQPTYMVVRLSDISTNTGKNAFFVFLGCFWAYAGQPHNN